jgi:hypothetical protein
LKRVVEARREAVLVAKRTLIQLGSHTTAVAKTATALDDAGVTARLFRKDPTLWPASGRDAGEQAGHLGWLDVCETMAPDLPRLATFAEQVRADGITHVLLCGMGGTALTAQLLRRTLGVAKGHLDLRVLDSTDPTAVATATAWSPPRHTLYLFASDSRATLELDACLRYFWELARAGTAGSTGAHFAAITEAGTTLDTFASAHGFRAVFRQPPDVGDRFAALSYAGLVPATLIGADPARLLERAHRMLLACREQVRADQNPGVLLGAILATLAARGHDKITLQAADRVQAFADCVEHLLAEATGREGRGLVPVVGAPRVAASELGSDRVFVHLRASDPKAKPLAPLARAGQPCLAVRLHDAYDLGAEFIRWQVAAVVASHLLGVDPFARPAADPAVLHAARLLEEITDGATLASPEGTIRFDDLEVSERLATHLRAVRGRGYVALCAFVTPTPRREHLLQDLRVALQRRLRVVTTLGFGPRYLHSTGTLHRNGPAPIAVVHLTADTPNDIGVPGSPWTFGTLLAAHALGDHAVLTAAGRPVLRIHLGASIERALQRLVGVAQRLAKPSARPAPTRRAARTARRR